MLMKHGVKVERERNKKGIAHSRLKLKSLQITTCSLAGLRTDIPIVKHK